MFASLQGEVQRARRVEMGAPTLRHDVRGRGASGVRPVPPSVWKGSGGSGLLLMKHAAYWTGCRWWWLERKPMCYCSHGVGVAADQWGRAPGVKFTGIILGVGTQWHGQLHSWRWHK
jgi:hypothetical protein